MSRRTEERIREAARNGDHEAVAGLFLRLEQRAGTAVVGAEEEPKTPVGLGAVLEQAAIETFVCSGNKKGRRKRVTIRNTTTGNRFTYEIVRGHEEDTDVPRWWIHLIDLGDDSGTYIGQVDGRGDGNRVFDLTNASKIREGDPRWNAVRGFGLYFQKALKGTLPADVEWVHEGRCGNCGRRLDVPERTDKTGRIWSGSRIGLGPDCAKNLGRGPNTVAA